jgi:hypothetical protein
MPPVAFRSRQRDGDTGIKAKLQALALARAPEAFPTQLFDYAMVLHRRRDAVKRHFMICFFYVLFLFRSSGRALGSP